MNLAETITLAALRHADHCVREFLLERCDGPVMRSGTPYYDTAPLFNANEYKPETLDLHQQIYRYAVGRRIVEPHPNRAGLARINDTAT